MAEKKYYAPPPRRRSSNAVRKELYRHLKGKPTHSTTLLSIPKVVGIAISRALMIFVTLIAIVAFMIGGVGSGMLVGYITTSEPVVTEQIKNKNEITRIKDATGEDIAILTGSQNINREYIAFSSVKATYIDEAFKAIEDERFDEHIGIDPKRIFSAVLSALANSGNATHGGSTISQQTVKLVSGADQNSAQRKVQEWYKAIQLEQQKTKDEIMELYINLVPMGNSYVGIQSAAKAYFDKDAQDLNLVECAFLAGIPNGPSTYNPLTESGKRNALRRMRIVLAKMHELKMISTWQYESALNTELVFRKTPQTVSATQINSYFVDYVIETVVDDLVEKRGYSARMASIAVYNYGFTIETTLDPFVQKQAEEAFSDQNLFISKPEILIDLPEKPNGSVVIIENMPNPGQIKGMVGGYGEKTGNFVLNRAVSTYRQPGSSIKPLAVYGPALDTGKITAASVFTDQEYFLDGDNPTKPYPKNSYTGYKGNMPVRNAIKISSNTIAAYIWKYVLGGETSLLYLKQVGIDRSSENYVSISLGAFNIGMTTLEMAGAYATFANEGLYTDPYAYTRVLDAEGKVLLDNRPQFTQVYKVETAFIMTDIMKGVFTSGGTAGGRGLKDMPAAGKTGTTDDNRDKWFCGYTRYYTAAVWYGYDNRLGLTTIPAGEDRNSAIKIWQDIMNRIHVDKERLDFVAPKSILTMTVCPDSGQKVSPDCPVTVTEYFIPGAVMNPRDLCVIHEPLPSPTPVPVFFDD
jgi:penicillin-binding protein 1A